MTIIVLYYTLQDSCSFAASVRDYRHYLDATPTPPDAPQVKLELEKVQRARKAELKGNLNCILPFDCFTSSCTLITLTLCEI